MRTDFGRSPILDLSGEPQTLEWCYECEKWHMHGSLTICALKRARDVLKGKPFNESKAIKENPQSKPWKVLED